MAHAYTPGLQVSPDTVIRKQRQLPIPGEVLVSGADHVTATTEVAQTALPGTVYPVNVVNKLSISPGDIRAYMLKQEGEWIEKGDILAENNPYIKWFKTRVQAPISRTIESISHVTGQVFLREPPEVIRLSAYVDGTIAQVIPHQGVVVESHCAFVQGIFGVGGETAGIVSQAVLSPKEELTAQHLTPEHTDCIIIGGALAPKETFLRAQELGVRALVVGAVVLVSIHRARENPHMFLRRIPGLDAVEEAVGRATEMGRPVLYLTGSGELNGSGDPSNLSTIAATGILGEVAKRVATYGTELQVPHRSAIVMAICQEMVKESYVAVGRPDAYREEANFFITQDQFAYTAAVDGIMVREKPAANLFMGYYYAESLLLAETGATTGAIQIAGTDADYQLPFFITACDYTLIGEELYAASAYLSREPALVGTLRGQDLGKGFLLCVVLIGSLLVTLGEIFKVPVVRTVLQTFSDFR